MAVELRPLSVKCNIACHYCYQHPQRDAEAKNGLYDMQKMKDAILREDGSFVLFGGEPLLVPFADLEELFAWGYERFGKNGIQTNGSLITPAHIELFKKYQVHVGISVDGPVMLNDIRWAGTLARTRELSQKTHQNIRLLIDNAIIPGIIVTLHTGNALPDVLPAMGAWMKELDDMGIKSARLHLMEVDNAMVGENFRLSARQNIEAMLYFHELEKGLKNLRFDVFGEIERLLNANDKNTSCVWNACDPYTTAAVRGVEGDGKRSNCGRTNKEGIDFVKAPLPSYSRYIALYNTPQEFGGCKGCRFFAMCKGHCPGTSIEGDWRNRTEHCEVWKTLFTIKEKEMIDKGVQPLSTYPGLRYIEAVFLKNWAKGKNPNIAGIINHIHQSKQTQPA
ncbi:radical SAM protein [Mucilaginibacter sp. PPCGB 2223]|uniref:radical SAM protein n=1 Tax=Mucilaginibacter sp. PPCGB 2223 TaxID=1886027 RepID=UPI000825EB57|nr:radical SAM protein [Mucilaginibacter sp. PPCGB 2223]OCX52984.1 radical SAM protein [Mucilaginibacter sp. PPCGB 2223]